MWDEKHESTEQRKLEKVKEEKNEKKRTERRRKNSGRKERVEAKGGKRTQRIIKQILGIKK